MGDNTRRETFSELRHVLRSRRRCLSVEICSKIRDLRTEATHTCRQTTDPDDPTEIDLDDDVSFALLQLKAHVIGRIDDALQRVDERTYGTCIDCDGPIAAIRLRALPFATRCLTCETQRELAERDMRRRTLRAFDVCAAGIRH